MSSAGSGAPGDVEARCSGDGAFLVRTQEGSGFEETGVGKKTLASQVTVANLGNITLGLLGAVAANGNNMMFDVFVSAQDSSTDSDIVTAFIRQTFYRSGGTVSPITVLTNVKEGNGAGTFVADLSFSLFATADNVFLRIANANFVTSYTLNVAFKWERQLGGIAS